MRGWIRCTRRSAGIDGGELDAGGLRDVTTEAQSARRTNGRRRLFDQMKDILFLFQVLFIDGIEP